MAKKKKKLSKKYLVGDSPTSELYIDVEFGCEDEADGEFIFDTLNEAKAYCLGRINNEIRELELNRQCIEEIDDE